MPADITPSARFAADLADTIVKCHHGDHAAALTSAIGAVILLCGIGGESGQHADAMYQIAADAIAEGRRQVAENRAADAARSAVVS